MSIESWLKEHNIKVTRESYIDAAWGRPLPDPWTAEEESMLPEELQDWDLFDTVDGELVLKKDAYPNDIA